MTLEERFAPNETQISKYIILPNTNTTHFKLKPAILRLFLTFYDKENENPYTHVDKYLNICSTFKFQNFSDESVRLRLFSFSLKDQARAWFNHLVPNSINTWRDLNFKFVSKFYPMPRINQYRRKISTFKQKREKFMNHGKSLRISKSSLHTIILRNDVGPVFSTD